MAAYAAWFLLGAAMSLAADNPAAVMAYEALKQKNYDQAIAAFRQAIQAEPERHELRRELAYTLLKTGETEPAREVFGEIVRLAPADWHSALEYGYLCHETRRVLEARRVFDRVRKNGDAAARKAAEQAFQSVDGPLADAMSRWFRALTQNPGDYSAHVELADAAADRDEWKTAAEHFQAAWSLRPNDRQILVELGHARKESGDLEGAHGAWLAAARGTQQRAAEKARELLPHRHPYASEFRRALELDRGNVELRRELAFLYLAVNQAANAETEFRNILEFAPSDLLSLAQLGFLRLARGDREGAMPYLNKVLQGRDGALIERVRDALAGKTAQQAARANPQPATPGTPTPETLPPPPPRPQPGPRTDAPPLVNDPFAPAETRRVQPRPVQTRPTQAHPPGAQPATSNPVSPPTPAAAVSAKGEPASPKPQVAKPAAPEPAAPKPAPVKTDTVKTDTVKTDTVKADAAKTPVAKAERAKAEAPKAEPAKSAPARPDTTKPDPAKPASAPKPSASADPKSLGDKSYSAGYLKDALRYYELARDQNPRDAETHLKLGYTHNMLRQDEEAIHYFDMARKGPDPKVRAEASRAYHNLRPMTARFRSTGWLFPMFSSRWHEAFSYGQWKVDMRLGNLPFRPYFTTRIVADSQRSGGSLQPQYLSESSLIFGLGIATTPWRGLTGWGEAGSAVRYRQRHDVGRMVPDYRAGLNWSRGFGRLIQSESPGFFLETSEDMVMLSRFRWNLLFYSQNRAGFTFPSIAGIQSQVVWNVNLTGDRNREHWANFLDTGPGVRFRTKRMPPSMVWSIDLLRGHYLIREGNPRGPIYYDVRAGVWYAITR